MFRQVPEITEFLVQSGTENHVSVIDKQHFGISVKNQQLAD